jgi:ADP-heptose:LPS heptosyltransferase
MHGSGRISTPLALALGGQVTAGYYDGDRPAGLSVGAPYPGGSEIQRNLDLARLLGCPDLGVELEFPLSGEDRAEATRHLGCLPRADRPWVGIHPGARAPARRWSPRRFAALADVMAREHRAQIILTGGAAEREIVAEVRRHMTAEALDLSGRTTIGGLAALIERLDLFVSNDSGPAHLAVAVGTASVVIFGPAEVARWAPLDATRHPVVRRDVPCSPCGYTDCPIDHRCLEWIDPSNVLAAARRLLSLPAASAGQGGAPSGPHAMTGTAEYAQGPKPARVRPRRCVPSRSTTIHLCHPESPPCDL